MCREPLPSTPSSALWIGSTGAATITVGMTAGAGAIDTGVDKRLIFMAIKKSLNYVREGQNEAAGCYHTG